jgi:hypothetical protein
MDTIGDAAAPSSFETVSGHNYGFHFHRYRAGASVAEAHEHGDALVLRVPDSAAAACASESDHPGPLTWADVLTAARIASASHKSFYLVPASAAAGDVGVSAYKVDSGFLV